MKLVMLSSKKYAEEGKDYGDCTIIDTGTNVIIYDCGSEEHAKEVEFYLNKYGYDKALVILSHNDADHFAGLPYLISNDRIKSITTLLLLKHVAEILGEMDDGRRSIESVKRHIGEYFDNVKTLSGNNLNDAMDDTLMLDPCINIVGPDHDFIIEAVAKALDESESDMIAAETIVNAISVQVEVIVGNHKLLLTGDAAFDAIKDKVREYDAIQLPHHGKFKQASEIFELNKGRNSDVIYLVSDNKYNHNGGSEELMNSDEKMGKDIRNTQFEEILLDINSFTKKNKGIYGYEIHHIEF